MRLLAKFIEEVLGPCKVTSDRSQADGHFSLVLEVEDAGGVTWFVKQHRNEDRYRTEVAAYGRWVPALDGHAPKLRATDDELRAVVLSSVPGATFVGHDVDVHRRAGALLRCLHNAEMLSPSATFAADKQAELEYWTSRSSGLLDQHQLDFARSELQELGRLPPPPLVPCHLDYSPRNWMVCDDQLYVIDFEQAAPDAWVNDLGRLWFGPWRARPDLKTAFLGGYGRSPGDADLTVLIRGYALVAVRDVILARASGKLQFESAVRDIFGRLMRREFDTVDRG